MMNTFLTEQTRNRFPSLFWGLLLIAGGGLALAQNQGYLSGDRPGLWAALFAAAGLFALVFYFLSGVHNWAMLIPAGVFGGLGMFLGFVASGEAGSAAVSPLFIGLSLPFIVAYLLNRSQNWWALIPTGVMVFLAYVLLVADRLPGEAVAAGLFFILFATFGLVYLQRRELWAALVAYIMFALGCVILLTLGMRPDLTGVLVPFAIALPFFLVYFRSPSQHWWALIPAGILTSSSLMTGLILLPGLASQSFAETLANAAMSLGVALTFLLLGLRHNQRWALVVAGFAAVLGVLQSVSSNMERFWPVLLIVAGLLVLFQALRPARA
jgi:hypothetical protein